MEQQNPNMSDHDLLITLHTTLKRVVEDIKDLKDNTVGRINALEDRKLDKIDAETIRKDSETRLRDLEKAKTEMQTQLKMWVVIGGGIWTIVSFVLTLYFK